MTGDRIVLGLGGTIDYLVTWDATVIEQLVVDHGITAAELSTAIPIDSERDLLRCLLAFVRDGIGGERFVVSSAILEAFARHFVTEIALGGTATRAGLALDLLGIPSTLHLVSVDDHVRRLLPPGCRYVTSADHDSTHPHLILQFEAGARVRAGDLDLSAPHANRVILTHDPPHELMRLSPDLGAALADARVFLISGLNAIRDPAVLDERLTELRAQLAALDPGCRVHYEDAGFHNPVLTARVNAALDPVIDVHSMNEDELQGYLGRPCALLDPDDMARALLDLPAIITAPTVVVHTSTWSLALGRDASAFTTALASGIALASARYAYGDAVDAALCRQVAQTPPGGLRCRLRHRHRRETAGAGPLPPGHRAVDRAPDDGRARRFLRRRIPGRLGPMTPMGS